VIDQSYVNIITRTGCVLESQAQCKRVPCGSAGQWTQRLVPNDSERGRPSIRQQGTKGSVAKATTF
jgi:hypothetical protein